MELEPITRKEKIIAGENLEPITRLEKFLKEYGGSGGSGGGGSSDAVLYTPQTLTDAQKKQARDNIDATSDFVVNGTLDSDMTATLDKTFEQIQAAIQDGKRPVVKLTDFGLATFIPMVGYNSSSVAFMSLFSANDSFIVTMFLSITSAGNVKFSMTRAATQQYVDDEECILKSTTPGSTKKFKITVDDSGNISATEVI